MVAKPRPYSSLMILILGILLVPPVAVPAKGGEKKVATRAEIHRKLREEKKKKLKPYVLSKWERRILNFEKNPPQSGIFVKGFHGIHAVIGGMPTGSGLFGGGDHALGRFDIARDRLFKQHVLASLAGVDELLLMQEHGRGDVDGLDLVAG